MLGEQLVPIKDEGAAQPLKKQSSFGSDKGLNTEGRGEEDTLEYRIDTKNEAGKTISLWHDINVNHIDPETGNETEYLNFVCEIPKFTRYDKRENNPRNICCPDCLCSEIASMYSLQHAESCSPMQKKIRNCYR